MNRTGPSSFFRNLSGKMPTTSRDKTVRLSSSISKPSPMKPKTVKEEPVADIENINPEYEMEVVSVQVESRSQNISRIDSNEANCDKNHLNQSRHLEELLKSTNSSLVQLKVEIGKFEADIDKKEEVVKKEEVFRREEVAIEPINHSLVQYHKDLINELREENHKLLIADLKLKNDMERFKETTSFMNTENSALKERISAEKIKNEIWDQEIAALSRTNAELNTRIYKLEWDIISKEKDDYSKLLELKRKDELMKTISDQIHTETDTRRRHNIELELEIVRNGKLQAENEKLKIEGRSLLEAVDELKKEIRYLKMSNQGVLELLRY